MQRPDLQAIAAKWIKLFRIQDRLITVSYVPNLVNPSNGDTVYALLAMENDDEGRYSIFVQDPATWPANAARPPTQKVIEGAVRHECAHIRVRDFAPRNPSDSDILAEERAVWAISDAFDAVNEMNAPQFAAMVVKQLDRKPQTLAQVAGQIRAMTATAATRRQTQGTAMDDNATLATLELIQAASTPEEKENLLTAAIAQLKAKQGLDGAPPSVPDPNAPPMGAEAGAVDPNKDKPPMAMGDEKKPEQMMRSMKADLADVRAMKAELTEALNIVRPSAKVELVRAMRVDGINLTPANEKLITDAPTLHDAQTLAKGMRAMAPVGARREPAKQPGNDDGLTPVQATKYRSMVAANNPRAESWRDETLRANAKAKKGGV